MATTPNHRMSLVAAFLVITLLGCDSPEADSIKLPTDRGRVAEAVKNVKPSEVRAICFVRNGEYRWEEPPSTGPVTSRAEIATILGAMSRSSWPPTSNRDHESVFIILKNGKTVAFHLKGMDWKHGASAPSEIGRIMAKYQETCSHEQLSELHIDRKLITVIR